MLQSDCHSLQGLTLGDQLPRGEKTQAPLWNGHVVMAEAISQCTPSRGEHPCCRLPIIQPYPQK